jgi:peptidoglycan/LPS O-acetylase OafA/YrhL
MRGIAAILVVLQHIRQIAVADASGVPDLAVWQKPFYFITALGDSSVMIFFVLSGFLVGSSVIKAITTDRWSWAKYATARISRIYSVLIPALLIGAGLDIGGNFIFGHATIYASDHYNVTLPHRIITMITPVIWVGNLFSLQGIFVPTLGSNGPLWSLANEWWYYILYPLAILPIVNRNLSIKSIAYVCLCIMILTILTPSIRWLFLVWLMGACIVFLPQLKAKVWHIGLCGTLLVFWLAFGALNLFGGVYVDLARYMTGFLAASLIYLISCRKAALVNGIYARCTHFLASISYTLYLTHMPFIVFVTAFLIQDGPKLLPNLSSIAATIAIAILSVIYAVAIWYLFERHTNIVKQWLESILAIKGMSTLRELSSSYQSKERY